MKRVFQHPPEQPNPTGRKYWRSVGELQDTPGVSRLAGARVPRRGRRDGGRRRVAAAIPQAHGRFAGAGGLRPERLPPAGGVPRALHEGRRMADPGQERCSTRRPCPAAGARCRWSPRRPKAARSSWKATASTRLATARPIPSRSARCSICTTRTARATSCTTGKPVDVAKFAEFMKDLRETMLANGGAGAAILVEETFSPTRDRLRAELDKQFPSLRLVSVRPAAAFQRGRSHARGVRRRRAADAALRPRGRDPLARQRLPRPGRGRHRSHARFHQPPPRRQGERLDEPALRRREPLHDHRRHGRPPPALPGQPDRRARRGAGEEDRRRRRARRDLAAAVPGGRGRRVSRVRTSG